MDELLLCYLQGMNTEFQSPIDGSDNGLFDGLAVVFTTPFSGGKISVRGGGLRRLRGLEKVRWVERGLKGG